MHAGAHPQRLTISAFSSFCHFRIDFTGRDGRIT
jgi:hypothetical protein